MKSYLHKIFRIRSSDSSKLQIYGGWYPHSATYCLVSSWMPTYLSKTKIKNFPFLFDEEEKQFLRF